MDFFELEILLWESDVWIFIERRRCHYSLTLSWTKALFWACEWDNNTNIWIYPISVWKLWRVCGIWPFGMSGHIRETFCCGRCYFMGLWKKIMVQTQQDIQTTWNIYGPKQEYVHLNEIKTFSDLVSIKIQYFIWRCAVEKQWYPVKC